ncbi:MAG: hypothetical protein Q7R41_05495, partial [Phycisphaerales bacterium]|nr:hypothetical protein [Phycisphaerales bacterium]
EYLASKLGFELFDDKTERDRVIAIVEARNLVVHNRGIVNARYLNRVPDSTYAEGDNIDLGSEVIDDLEYLMRIALRSDRRAVEKWGLPEKACHDWAGSMRIARATAST